MWKLTNLHFFNTHSILPDTLRRVPLARFYRRQGLNSGVLLPLVEALRLVRAKIGRIGKAIGRDKFEAFLSLPGARFRSLRGDPLAFYPAACSVGKRQLLNHGFRVVGTPNRLPHTSAFQPLVVRWSHFSRWHCILMSATQRYIHIYIYKWGFQKYR